MLRVTLARDGITAELDGTAAELVTLLVAYQDAINAAPAGVVELSFGPEDVKLHLRASYPGRRRMLPA